MVFFFKSGRLSLFLLRVNGIIIRSLDPASPLCFPHSYRICLEDQLPLSPQYLWTLFSRHCYLHSALSYGYLLRDPASMSCSVHPVPSSIYSSTEARVNDHFKTHIESHHPAKNFCCTWAKNQFIPTHPFDYNSWKVFHDFPLRFGSFDTYCYKPIPFLQRTFADSIYISLLWLLNSYLCLFLDGKIHENEDPC